MTDRMTLYITPTSPYARIVRVVIREKGLSDRIDEVAVTTRTPDSPYYAINPSGRVPSLALPDGTLMEDSVVICDYLDQLDGAPAFARPTGQDRWPFAMAEARARSLLDGLSVLVREHYRPEAERSPGVIAHEVARARRLFAGWEEAAEAAAPWLSGHMNYVQLVLIAAITTAGRAPELDPASLCPRLAARLAKAMARPALVETDLPQA